MTNIQIKSVQSPFDDPVLAAVTLMALSRADAMGLLRRQITCLDNTVMKDLETGMLNAGIGHALFSEFNRLSNSNLEGLTTLLERINEALEESPAPDSEWRTLYDILGVELLAKLLGISHSSVRRYLLGNRTTPDTISARLHFLAFIVGDLSGAYNDIGVRRWFARPRKQLDGHTPAQYLADDWLPNDVESLRVRKLAHSLVSSPTT